jgi:hypothetical protein
MHRPWVLTSKVLGLGLLIKKRLKKVGWVDLSSIMSLPLGFSGCIMVKINADLLMKDGTTKEWSAFYGSYATIILLHVALGPYTPYLHSRINNSNNNNNKHSLLIPHMSNSTAFSVSSKIETIQLVSQM